MVQFYDRGGGLPYKPSPWGAVGNIGGGVVQGMLQRKEQAINNVGYMNQLAQRNPEILKSAEYQRELKIANLPAIKPREPTSREEFFADIPEGYEGSWSVDPMTGLPVKAQITPQRDYYSWVGNYDPLGGDNTGMSDAAKGLLGEGQQMEDESAKKTKTSMGNAMPGIAEMPPSIGETLTAPKAQSRRPRSLADIKAGPGAFGAFGAGTMGVPPVPNAQAAPRAAPQRQEGRGQGLVGPPAPPDYINPNFFSGLPATPGQFQRPAPRKQVSSRTKPAPRQPKQTAKQKYKIGQPINIPGKGMYKVVGFDTDGEPLVEPVR